MNLAPSEFDLFLGRGPYVRRGHDGAEPARRRDRLQAGDADAHDEDFRRRNRAGRGHHHRHGAAEFRRRIDHGAVAGEIGLARKHVHDLRAGDARHQFHGEGVDAGTCEFLQGIDMAVGIHDRDDRGPRLDAVEFFGAWAAHAQDDIGLGNGRSRIGRDRGAGRGIISIAYRGFDPGSRFDGDFCPEAEKLLHRLRRRGNPCLRGIGFGRHSYTHEELPIEQAKEFKIDDTSLTGA